MCVKSRGERLIVTYFPFKKDFCLSLNETESKLISQFAQRLCHYFPVSLSLALSLSRHTHKHCPSFCLISQHWLVSVSRGIGKKKYKEAVPRSSTADWLAVNERMNETRLRRGRGLWVMRHWLAGAHLSGCGAVGEREGRERVSLEKAE